MTKNMVYQSCVSRFLSRLCSSLKADLAADAQMVRLADIQRSSTRKGRGGAAQTVTRRISGLAPAADWLDRYENRFDECLGSLEAFRPAAGNLPEFRKLSDELARLRSLLNFAQTIQA